MATGCSMTSATASATAFTKIVGAVPRGSGVFSLGLAPTTTGRDMNHFIYTTDIATVAPLTEQQRHDLIMAIDAVLESFPLEFEDWKINYSTEQRVI